MHTRLRLIVGAAALATLATAALSAQAPCEHNSYAFKNAHVITVTGPALDNATVVVCNGIITAVGASATAPAGAEVIDATGLTLYPGFVDGYSQYGLPTPAAAAAGAGRGGGRGNAGQAEAAQAQAIAATLDGVAANDPLRYLQPLPNGVESERVTYELLQPEATLEAVRNQGILATMVVPADGVFKGEAAVVNLVGPDAAAMLVLPRVGQVIQLTAARGGAGASDIGSGGGSGYPASTMGAVAIYRQSLDDAQRLATSMQIYQQVNHKGLPPPTYDPKVMPLLGLVNHTEQAYFVAGDENGIERALKLAAEYQIAKPIIIGGNEAAKSIPALQAAHASVLLSLSFTAGAAGGRGGGGGGGGRGGAGAGANALQGTAAALIKAGIPVGFTTEGLTGNTELVAQVKTAMRSGLSEADAWKALTLWPAQILGASDQLGSVEVGKIANLALATANPLTGDATNKWIVVDGHLFPVHSTSAAPAAARGRGARGGQPNPSENQ